MAKYSCEQKFEVVSRAIEERSNNPFNSYGLALEIP